MSSQGHPYCYWRIHSVRNVQSCDISAETMECYFSTCNDPYANQGRPGVVRHRSIATALTNRCPERERMLVNYKRSL